MKTTAKTKILAMLISIVLMVSMIPMGALSVGANTASSTPEGTAITDANGFLAMEEDGTYYLADDITLTETYAKTFKGTFDGNGNTVTTTVPMFGTVENATIKNFTVTSSDDITTGTSVSAGNMTEKAGIAIGAVACMALNSSFSAITNEAKISVNCTDKGLEVYCGGILGLILNAEDKTTVTNVSFTDCTNKGQISLSASNGNSAAGGMVGAGRFTAKGIISINFNGCKNNASIEAPKGAGMMGYTQHSELTALNSENKGNITAPSSGMAAGMVGQMAGDNHVVEFENCVNSGDCEGKFAGGVLAYINNGYGQSFVNCSNSGNISGTSHTGGIFGGINSYKSGETEFSYCSNEGSISGANYTGGIFGGFGAYSSGETVFSYCSNSGEIKDTTNFAAGIAGYLMGNSTMKACNNTGKVTGKVAGGFIGQAMDTDITISNCINSGGVYSNNTKEYIGGIIGWLRGSGVIEYCVNTGTIGVVDGVNGCQGAGGIAGQISNGTSFVRNCYNTGAINAGWNFAAGLVGVITSGTSVNNSYTSADVVGKAKDGATLLVGQIGVLHNTTSVTVSNNHYNSDKNQGAAIYALSGSGSISDISSTKAFTNADLASGRLAYDINQGAGKTVFYQNINENGAAKDANPVLDPTHGYVFEYNGSLYSLAFFTLQSASVRISVNEAERGLRFATAVNKADYNVLTNAGISLDFGTLITPDDYLAAAENNFAALDDGKYLDVNSTATGVDVFKEVNGADNETYYYFCGSITGIKSSNYDWDYSAIGYVTVNGASVYSGQYATRNIKYVAERAIEDAASYTDNEIAIIRLYLE